MIFLNDDYLVRGRSKEERIQISHDILKIYYLIGNEKRWCQKAMARDENGEWLDSVFSDKVCSVCLLGAVYSMNCSEKTLTYLEKCASIRKYDGLHKLNDKNNHQYVIDFIKVSLDILGIIKPKHLEPIK